MNLLALKQAQASVTTQRNHACLIYGPPKSGKSALVGTAARLPEIARIYWFDNENGWEVLLNIGLTDEELAKIVLVRMPDTRNNPIAIETTLKVLTSKTEVTICEAHGKVNCVSCRKDNKFQGVPFLLSNCTHSELVVFDSGSQLGESALNLACAGQDVTYKPTFDDFGKQGKYLADCLSVIQQCANTNFILITHEMVLEDEVNGVTKDKIYPLCGTKNFSRKVAKYFGTVIYTHMKAGKHAGGSTTTYKSDVLTGSRIGAALEKSKEMSMRDILVTTGVLKSASPDIAAKEDPAPAPQAPPAKQSSILDRLHKK
jgi:hypothetical protein